MVQVFMHSLVSILASLDFIGLATKSTFMLLLASIACWLLRHNSASMRHRIWTLGIAGSLLTPIVASLFPQLSIAILPTKTGEVVTELIDQPIGFQSTTIINSNPSQPPDSTLLDSGLSRGKDDNEVQSLGIEMRRQSIRSLDSVLSRIPEKASNSHLLMLVWGVGVAIVLLPFLFAVVLQCVRRRYLETIRDPEWQTTVKRLSRQLGLRTNVQAFTSIQQSVPAVYGAVFPYLVMPIGWRQWSDTQLECVLLHELAHVKRRDVAAQYLGRIGAAVYWFNPLAWYALRQLRIERELACDDWVLQTGTRASEYASQLLQTCRMARWSPMNLGVAMTHSARLDDRIVAVLDETRCRVLPTKSICCLATVVMVAVAIAIGVPVLVAGPSSQADMAVQTKGSNEKAADQAIASTNSRKHDTVTVRGHVLHGATPIEGATISLYQRFIAEGFYKDWHPREILDMQPKIVAISGKNGEFEFTISSADLVDTPKSIWPNPLDMIQVVASKVGMGVGWCKLKELNDRKKVWIRNTVPVHGRVIDLEGQPVRGVDIRVLAIQGKAPAYSYLAQPTWTGLTQNVVSDDSGRFTIVGLPTNTEDIRLYAQSPSIATKIFRVDLSDSEASVDVIVEPTKPIVGTIVDVDSRKPIAGAVVYGNDERMLSLVRAITNERGEYRLLGLPKSKKYSLTVHSLQPSPYLIRYSDIADTPGLTPLVSNMTMRKGVPVHVKVIDKRTRELLYPELHYSPTTDNPNYRESTRELYSPTDCYSNFHSADADGIVHFYAYEGRGLINIKLQGSGGYLPVGNRADLTEHVKTDITFAFSMGSHATAVIEARSDDSPLELTLEADPGETLTIRLVDESGKPVAGASGVNQHFNSYFNSRNGDMMAREDKPGPYYETGHGTQINGDSFTVHMLESNKPRLLAFTHLERKLMAMSIGDLDKPVEQITLKPWATVTGRVLDNNGNPLANTEVAVNYPSVKAEGNWPLQPKGKTDARGRFAIDRLIPGVEQTLTVDGMSIVTPESTRVVPSSGETIDLKDLKVQPVSPLSPSPSK